MKNDNLVETIKTILEQKSAPFKGGGADIQDLSGPNKPVGRSEKEQHHGVDEAALTGSKKRPRFRNLGKLETRRGSENQIRRPANYLGEVRKLAMEKIQNKKTGLTDTKRQPESVDVNPEMKPMNGNY